MDVLVTYAVVAYAASRSGVDFIVTRNEKDFALSPRLPFLLKGSPRCTGRAVYPMRRWRFKSLEEFCEALHNLVGIIFPYAVILDLAIDEHD